MFMSSLGLGPKTDCSVKAQKQLHEQITPSHQTGHPTSRNLQLSDRKQKSGNGLQMGA
jgi:hypothetical protein